MIGRVDPCWRHRIDIDIACPDNAFIPRVPGAGELQDGLITMHNGIKVGGLSYYGSGIMNLLIENRGVHEPQEERAFSEVLPYILNILHSDIQGFEVDMLKGAREMLSNRKVDLIFISTHSNEVHADCIELLEAQDYVILASADLDNTFSVDGLIVAKRAEIPEPRSLQISQR